MMRGWIRRIPSGQPAVAGMPCVLTAGPKHCERGSPMHILRAATWWIALLAMVTVVASCSRPAPEATPSGA